MKNVLMLVLALVIVWIVWNILWPLLATTLHFVLWIGMIVLFSYLVYAVYKMLTKKKLIQ